MPLPPPMDERIRKQFVTILNRAAGIPPDGSELYLQLKTELFALLHQIDAQSTYFKEVRAEINQLYGDSCSKLIEYVRALDKSYRAGVFDSAVQAIEAEVTTDYLTQAESLLTGAESRQYSHVAAAMLAGALLEDRLRRLCQRQIPTFSLLRGNNQRKTLNDFIDDLKKAGLYNELKAKQLRAWADVRNAAAHGEFDKFTRADVENMLSGIKAFLAELS